MTPLIARVRVTGNLSGVDRVQVALTAPSVASHQLGDAVRISGDTLNGIWGISASVPSNMSPGIYAIRFGAYDALGQFAALTTDPPFPDNLLL